MRLNVWLFSFTAWPIQRIVFFFKKKSTDIYWFHLPVWVQLVNDLEQYLCCFACKQKSKSKHFLFRNFSFSYGLWLIWYSHLVLSKIVLRIWFNVSINNCVNNVGGMTWHFYDYLYLCLDTNLLLIHYNTYYKVI